MLREVLSEEIRWKNKGNMVVNTIDRQEIISHDKIESSQKNWFSINSELEYNYIFQLKDG